MASYMRVKSASDSALYSLHPELASREHLFTISSEEQSPQATAGYQQAASDYAGHVWVQKAVRVISDNLAPLPLRVVDRKGAEIVAHPITDLLNNVNNTQTAPDLWKQWATDMMLGGESGFEMVRGRQKGFVEIWARQPTQFTVIPDPARKRYYGVKGYRIKFDPMDSGFTVPPDEFVHFKFYNPLLPWRGLAPIQAVRMSIVIDQLAQAWSRLFFKNQARPDYAVIAPQGLAPSEKDDLEARLMAKFGGASGWHRPIILENDVDIKPFSFPPKDVEWINQRELARDEIGAIFGVPDEIMGYGKDTYENFGAAREVLWTLMLVPLVGHRDGTLTESLHRNGQLKPGEQVMTDLSNVAELQDDLDGKTQVAQRLFMMGVPFGLINDRLKLGLETKAIPGADLPFGGKLGAGSTPPNQAGSADVAAKSVQRTLKREFQRQQNEVLRRLRNLRVLGKGTHLSRDKVHAAARMMFEPTEETAAFCAALSEMGDLAVLDAISTAVNTATFEELAELFEQQEAAGASLATVEELVSAYFRARKSDANTEEIARMMTARLPEIRGARDGSVT
jgi:HK97 family phage portal protein